MRKLALLALLLGSAALAQPRPPLTRALADALYVKLAGGNTVAGLSTFTNLTVTGTCTGCGISGVAWGAITGTLSNQTDLQNALNLKAPLNSPSFTTPALNVATATSINKVAITAPATSATLTIADGATLTASASATVSGTNTGDQTLAGLGGLALDGTTTGATSQTQVFTNGVTTGGNLTAQGGGIVAGVANSVGGYLRMFNASGVRALRIQASTGASSDRTIDLNWSALTATRSWTLPDGNLDFTPLVTPTGTGAAVLTTSPIIVTPTIASFTNATHNHQNAAGGGTLTDAAIVFTTPNIGAPTVGAGGSGTNTALLQINSGSGSGGWGIVRYQRNSVNKALIGLESGGNLVGGAADNDLCISNAQTIDFSANAGVGSQLTLNSTGLTTKGVTFTLDGTAQSLAAYTTTGAEISTLARSITDSSSSGTVAVNAVNALGIPTLLASNATTYTDSCTLYLSGPPVASTNVTQTRAHTLAILDSTSAASSITGGLVVAAGLGTTATSVGIGGGNINAGGNGTFGGTLSVTGAVIPSQTNGITGTTTNNNANAGAVGEYVTGTVAANTTSLSTGTTANVGTNTNITLTAGDWDCSGAVNFTFGATTSITNLTGGVSTTTATLPAQDSYFDYETSAIVPTGSAVATWVVPTVRVSASGSTSVFLVSQATFTVSTIKVGGTIRCRRMR